MKLNVGAEIKEIVTGTGISAGGDCPHNISRKWYVMATFIRLGSSYGDMCPYVLNILYVHR